jgi:uncharacterized protein YggL (DUF469 family)
MLISKGVYMNKRTRKKLHVQEFTEYLLTIKCNFLKELTIDEMDKFQNDFLDIIDTLGYYCGGSINTKSFDHCIEFEDTKTNKVKIMSDIDINIVKLFFYKNPLVDIITLQIYTQDAYNNFDKDIHIKDYVNTYLDADDLYSHTEDEIIKTHGQIYLDNIKKMAEHHSYSHVINTITKKV